MEKFKGTYLNRQKKHVICVIVGTKCGKEGGFMLWNKPKSVRQIGDIPGHEKVYVEDYVIRFAKKLARESKGEEKAAVLLGASFTYEESKIYLISGIVEIRGFSGRTSPELTPDMWDRIYAEIKENFTDLEITGWLYTSRGIGIRDASRLLEIHKRNFQHRDKVLYLLEEAGQEDGVFLYRGGKFEKQKGYYIYYEKNPEMLRYMEKEAERHIHIVEQEDDRVLRNIRGIMAEKEEKKQKKQKDSRLSYGMGTMVAMIVLLLGAAALKNQTTLNQVRDQLGRLQQMALGEQQAEGTTVETLGSSLTKKMTASPVAVEGEQSVSGSAAVQGKDTHSPTPSPDKK